MASLQRLHGFLLARTRAQLVAFTILTAAAVGLVDVNTWFEVNLSILYLIPVAIASLYVGRRAGYVTAAASATVWLAVNWITAGQILPGWVIAWNASTRLTSFLVAAWLLGLLQVAMTQLQSALEDERHRARTDRLTGVANAEAFREAATRELERSARYEHDITIAFLDVDDFKRVNDTWGHARGDQVLREIALVIAANVRQSDTVARMGGDEFAILFPETDARAARRIADKLQQRLAGHFPADAWPVSVSYGAIVAHAPSEPLDQLLQAADQLMYRVKRRGKNAVLIEALGTAVVPPADALGPVLRRDSVVRG